MLHTTNTHHSSTIFAGVRASSLGLAVSDLSWVYCWAAIWGNIELGFGILGAVSRILATASFFPRKKIQLTKLSSQNLALSRTYWDFFKRGLDTIASKTRSTGNKTGPRSGDNGASNSYALGSVPKSSNKNSKNSSNPLSASTLTHNSSRSPTWDGSNNKSSQVQIHGRRASSAESNESDEIPLHGRDAMGLGIERKIEFSVEADARSGHGEAGGWGRDLEREGTSEGDGVGREVRIGRGL